MGKSSVLFVSSPSCGPCKRFVPVWDEAKLNYPGYVFERVDSAIEYDRVMELGVRAVPTFILYDSDGVEVERFSGANSSKFYDMLNRWL